MEIGSCAHTSENWGLDKVGNFQEAPTDEQIKEGISSRFFSFIHQICEMTH